LNADSVPGPVRRGYDAPPARLDIRLPAALRRQIVAYCVAELPLEGCGLLLGERAGTLARIAEAWPATIARASAECYEIDPETVLAADRAARAQGRVLLGAWHSHPGGPAVPSGRDRDEAWPDWCYLILDLADAEAPVLRAWRLFEGEFVEDALEIT
jgi:proteasome lid subunit RPN8/RPN11